MPITVACFPVFFRDERRNSLPMEKAMKPVAACVIMLKLLSCSVLENPMPGMLRAPIRYGPRIIRVRIYAVAAGS